MLFQLQSLYCVAMLYIGDEKDYRRDGNGQSIGKETEICGS